MDDPKMNEQEENAMDTLTRDGCSPAACSAVWVVVGETGEYSDYSEWNVAAFTEEEQAEAFKDACKREVERIKKPGDGYPRVREGFKHAYDTQFHMDYTGTDYRVEMVQVFDSFTPNDKGHRP